MAPRRYGSGNLSCSSYAFESDTPRIDVAFSALYLIVSIALFFVATRRFGQSKKHGQPVAGSIWLCLALIFAILCYIATIVITVLQECDTLSTRYYFPAWTVSIWLWQLSSYILTAVILTSICRKLQNEFARVQQSILTLQTGGAALLGVIVVAYLGLTTAIYHYTSYYNGRTASLAEAQRGLRMTALTLSVACMLLASATMYRALFQAPVYLRSKSIETGTIALILSALGYTATDLGGYVQLVFIYGRLSGTADYNAYLRSSYAISFIASFFYSVAFYAAIRVASYRSQPAATTSNVISDPYAAPPPLRFTTDPSQLQTGYAQSPEYSHNHGYPYQGR
ncbi:hypothetical protein BJX76DRAFT_355227 [Aspergillus varians]